MPKWATFDAKSRKISMVLQLGTVTHSFARPLRLMLMHFMVMHANIHVNSHACETVALNKSIICFVKKKNSQLELHCDLEKRRQFPPQWNIFKRKKINKQNECNSLTDWMIVLGRFLKFRNLQNHAMGYKIRSNIFWLDKFQR